MVNQSQFSFCSFLPQNLIPSPPPSLPQFFDQDGDGMVTQLDLSSKLPISKLPQQPKKGHRDGNSTSEPPTEMDYGT